MDLDRDEGRTFRLDRMSDLAATTFRFTARTLPAAPLKRLAQHFRRERTRGGHRDGGTLGRGARRPAVGDLEIEQITAGSTRVVLHLADWAWALQAVAALPAARLVEPETWCDSIRSFAERVLSTG